MKQLGILVIHGIGTSDENFDEPFKQRFFQELQRNGKNTDAVVYRKVFWAEYLDQRQQRYLDAARQKPNRLDWMWLRRFVITALADASAYQRKYGQSNRNYNNIIRRIFASLHEIRSELGSDDKPLLIFAHSLGAFIINNFIWDAHQLYAGKSVDWPQGVNPQGKFEHMINVAGMVTFGCNIPLFVIGNDPIVAIRFPHPDLPTTFRPYVEWNNFYDPDDVLGWPLKQLSYSFDGLVQPPDVLAYKDVVTRDIVFNVCGPLAWQPVRAHSAYWTHRKFIRAAVEQVARFLV